MVKELSNILKVDGDDYNINAVHSLAAGKVDNTLNINKTELDGSISSILFDGSEEQTVSIVPSEGGTFTGPVAVQSLNDQLELSDEDKKRLAINYADVLTVVQDLTGHPCFRWNGTELIGETVTKDDLTIEKISLIIGSSENYEKFITQEIKPIFFLYICEDTGQIFFGLNSDNYKQLSTRTLKVIYENNLDNPDEGFTAEDLAEFARLLQEHTDKFFELTKEDGGILDLAKKYTDALANGQVTLNTETIQQAIEAIGLINDKDEGILAKANKYTDGEIRKLDSKITENTTNISKNTEKINELGQKITDISATITDQIENGGILEQAKAYTDRTNATQDLVITENTSNIAINKEDINKIVKVSLPAILSEAKTDTADKVAELKSNIENGTVIAKNADNATKATRDANNNIITSYYQKKIIISTEDPSDSEGLDGDIWIKYSNI